MKLSLFGFFCIHSSYDAICQLGTEHALFIRAVEIKRGFAVIPRNWVIAHNRYFNPKRILNQPFVFKLAAKLLGKSKNLRAGEYFEAHSSPSAVLEKLSSGNIILRQLTIPEGLTS